ncbi:MAG: hypothetical protein ABIQ40_02985 [Bacteroidia bacterium]
MKIFVSIISILFLFSCSNPLEEKEETIELTYIAWGCECANWATTDDVDKYLNDNSGDTLYNRSIFIEPANSTLKLPDTLGFNGDLIKFTGHFHKQKGFPEGFHTDQPVDKARVFQYTSYKVITSNYREARGG